MQPWEENPEGYRIDEINMYLESLTGSPSDWRHSQYGRLLESLTLSAVEAGEDRPLPGRIQLAISTLENLRFALDAWPVTGRDDLAFWSHRKGLLENVKGSRSKAPNISTLESAVGDYLAKPYRSIPLDRQLVDALLASEFAAYAEQVHWSQALPFPAGQFAALTKRPLREFLLGRFWDVIVAAVIWLGFSWAAGAGLMPTSWLPYVFVALAAMYIASFTWATVAMPKYAKAVAVAKDSILRPLSEMADSYSMMDSAGPISLPYLRKRIVAAEEHGVRWPGALHALLDDIEARTQRI